LALPSLFRVFDERCETVEVGWNTRWWSVVS